MVLGAYILPTVGSTDPTSGGYQPADLVGNPAFAAAASLLPAGYRDVTSITNWDARADDIYALNITNLKDWKCIQREILALAETLVGGVIATWTPTTFAAGLTEPQRLIVAQYTIGLMPTAMYTGGFGLTEPQIEALITFFDTSSIAARTQRYNYAANKLKRYLSPADRRLVFNELIYKTQLRATYLVQDAQSDYPNILDYITAGGIFGAIPTAPNTIVGLAAKSVTPLASMALVDLVETVRSILAEGNY